MPKWLKRMFKGVILSAAEAALAVGIAKAKEEVSENENLTPQERRIVCEGLDVASDRALSELEEVL
jgi:hypothetical protein